MFMSITSSEQDALQKSRLEDARVFIVVYEGSVHLAKKLLQSAEASGNDTRKFIIVGTDGTKIDGFRNLTLDLPQGNPISVNRAFTHVAKMCYDNKDNFAFFDSDVTFLKPDAIGRLTEELMFREGSVLGLPVWVHNDKFHGWTWNGNAVYRDTVWQDFKLEEEPIPDDYPFDLYLSKKFFQRYCAPTVQQLQTEHKKNVKSLDWVSDNCVVHHPCSDGSLADCVMKKFMKHA